MGGFAKIMPITAAFFTLAGLSSLGLPGTAGFIAEFLVFLGAWEGIVWWWAIPGAIGAFLTAVYVLRAVKIIFWAEGPPAKYAHVTDANRLDLIALWSLGLALVIIGVWPTPLLTVIDSATTAYLGMIVQ